MSSGVPATRCAIPTVPRAGHTPGEPETVDPNVRRNGRVAAYRPLLWTLIAAAALAFAWVHRQELPAMRDQFRMANRAWLLVGTVLVGMWLVASGLMHRAGQRAAGWALPARRAVHLSAAASFLNVVTKSAGLAGVGPFFGEANRQSRSRAPVLAGYVAAMLSGETVFLGVLAVAVIVLVRGGRLSATVIIGMTIFSVYLAGRFAVVLAATRSRSTAQRIASLPRRTLARLRGRSAHIDAPPIADELFDAVHLLRAHPQSAFPVLAWAVVLEAVGVAMVVAATAAVGLPINLGQAVVVYATAVLFGIVGFLPGGLGFVELTTVAVLVSYGASAPQAAAAIVLYRAFELWLPGLIGALAAARSPR